MGLSIDSKRRFLKALEEVREFRYTVMGLLGFSEILDRITKIEEHTVKLEERFARLEERQQRLEEEMRETRRVLSVTAYRFGVLTETGFREAMKYVVEEVFGVATVEKRSLLDDEGIVYGHEAVIDIDVLIRDNEHIVLEVKSRVSRSDVSEIYRIANLYEKKTGVKSKKTIIGGFIEPRGMGDSLLTRSKNHSYKQGLTSINSPHIAYLQVFL